MSQLFGIDIKGSTAGPFSTVSRTYGSAAGSQPQWLAVKAASTHRSSAKEPHDIIKELRLLRSLSHQNIIEVLHHERSSHTLVFKMPYIAFSLVDLLASPLCAPNPSPFSSMALLDPDAPAIKKHQTAFIILTKSLIFQLITALAYLNAKKIAHRDIKPSNVLITPEGCVKLIDFGISYRRGEREYEYQDDLWPESKDKLYFEVSTGPYRAPELLFGARSYDLHAVDLWSLGASIVEFFTPLQLFEEDEEDPSFAFPSSNSQPSATNLSDESDESEEPEPIQPFILPRATIVLSPRCRWTRHSLFDASRGEIGLAWSIFKIRGTPTEESWPGFKHLPDAQRVTFIETPRVQLKRFLPNLPPPPQEEVVDVEIEDYDDEYEESDSETDVDDDGGDTPLNLIESLLAYPPSGRLTASEALCHLWFTVSPPILFPLGYSAHTSGILTSRDWEGNHLSHFLRKALGPAANLAPKCG
ncbi:hypothetical protein PC9H_002907 [Pleurotus ostreatus]|uniref:cyclin-dependent kinase n=1 Tax=Pleurotus ostreatus TaxID=5322 RepID=A0A8H7A1I3_PLEOS|nr:uncharacterized protein PC9H_002907 [Pleurotus ostreatus]KAF7436081.1 hypothetical protein PC9H_002907 [Pleurotus ostreatus]